MNRSGPLQGLRVLEIASLAPAPFGCTVLADMGADVIIVDRIESDESYPAEVLAKDPLRRGRRSVSLNLKDPRGRAAFLGLAATCDVIVEGFRPGVVERLGCGPEDVAAVNSRAVYARMTGWGQSGPLSQSAGHDINYLALSGALYPIGPADRPPMSPINYLGDFGAGGMLLVVGILSALLERERSGVGQTIDAAMLDGSALLSTFLHGQRGSGVWSDRRGDNELDGGAPYYSCYETSDGGFVAVGALEPHFYAILISLLGLDIASLPERGDHANWPELRRVIAAAFLTRTRDEWGRIFETTDGCVTPVLTPQEAPHHPHNSVRSVFHSVHGQAMPAPAPRLSRTPAELPESSPVIGQHTAGILQELGMSAEEIDDLAASGVVFDPALDGTAAASRTVLDRW